jgi:hypothetical protein
MPQPQGWHHRTEIRAATEIGQAAHVFDQVTGTKLRYSQPTGGTLPPAVWWVGGLPAKRAISGVSGVRDSARLATAPTSSLLIGSERPPAAGLGSSGRAVLPGVPTRA